MERCQHGSLKVVASSVQGPNPSPGNAIHAQFRKDQGQWIGCQEASGDESKLDAGTRFSSTLWQEQSSLS